MSDEKILLTEKKSGVGIITLNRPDKLNAFNDELTFQLQDALKEMEKDKEVRAIVITGAGRGFCSGQDLQSRSIAQEMGQRPSLGDSIKRRYNPIVIKLRRIEKPIIAAVNGVAAGAARRVPGVAALRPRVRGRSRPHAREFRWPIAGHRSSSEKCSCSTSQSGSESLIFRNYGLRVH